MAGRGEVGGSIEAPPIQMKMRRRIRIYRGSGAGSVSIEAPPIQMKMRSTIVAEVKDYRSLLMFS